MNQWTRRLAGLLLAGMWLSAALAQADPQAAARRQLAAERAAAQKRYNAAERACRERFIVTSCVDDARAELRSTLTRLRHQELALDEARRQQRTAERETEIARRAAARANEERGEAAQDRTEKRAAARARMAAPPASAGGHGASRSVAPIIGHVPPANRAASRPAEPSAGERKAAEASNRARYEARQRAAAKHRAEVERRNAAAAAEGRAAPPLSLPNAAVPLPHAPAPGSSGAAH